MITLSIALTNFYCAIKLKIQRKYMKKNNVCLQFQNKAQTYVYWTKNEKIMLGNLNYLELYTQFSIK